MVLDIVSKTIGSGDITGSILSVTFGNYEKVADAVASIRTGHSGDVLKVDNVTISGNVVDVHILRRTVVSGTSYTTTSGNQISGAVVTVIADCI